MAAYVGGVKRLEAQSGDTVVLRHGEGTLRYPGGFFTYRGQWVNNVKHGKGKLMLGDGGFYEGDFRQGEMTGFGVRQWADGSRYEGAWLEGEMHGEGVWSGRGEHYEGSFRAGLRDGMGSLKRADGAAYSGGFAAHRFHGKGTLRLADGSVYEGEFTAGARSGRGSWRQGDEEYAGPWAGDRPHGEGGVWRGEGGAVGYTGRWERGVPTERAASLRLLVAREHAPAEAKKAQTPASKKAPPTEPADPAQQLDPALAPLAAAGDAAPLKCAPGEPLCPSLCARLLTSSGATLASAERGRTLRVWLEQREAPGKPAVGFESPASAGDTAAAVDLERVIQVDGGCGDLGALTLASGAAPGSQLLLCVRANELARPGSLLFTGDGPIEARYPLLVGPAAKRKPTAAAAAGAAGRKQ